MTNIKKVSDKDLELKFEISVSVDELKQEMEKEAEKQQKTLKIDGFRKGKVPLSVIKNKYSALILSESAENLVENTINKIRQKFKNIGINDFILFDSGIYRINPIYIHF